MKVHLKLFSIFLCLLVLCSCSLEPNLEEFQAPIRDTSFADEEPYVDKVPDITIMQSEMSLRKDSSFEIHFLDVGQADAALVLCDNKAMLIDGGNAEESNLI